MVRITSMLALIATLGACSAQSADSCTRTPEMATSGIERNKQIVQRIYEDYINRARRELLPELVSENYVAPDQVSGRRPAAGPPDARRGPAAFAAVIEALRGGIPDIHFRIEDLVAEGDRVTVRWTWSGTHTGTLNGLLASNRQVKNAGIAIYELSEGKVSRAWLQTDRLGFLQQIGVVDQTLGRPPAQR